MGYRRKVYELTWPEGHELNGLEVTTKGLPIKKMFKMATLAEQLGSESDDTAAKVAAADELYTAFAGRLVSWNLEEDDGTPVPATLDGINDQDMGLMISLITTWMDAVSSVDTPLPPPSPDGVTTATAPDMAASIPMETLSPSLLS